MHDETTDLHSALCTPAQEQEQERSVGIPLMLLLAAISFFSSVATLPLPQVVLPARLAVLDASPVPLLSLFLVVGGIVAFLTYPFAGFLSDRLSTRFGRRRLWICLGAAGSSLALLAFGLVSSLPLLMLSYACFQASLQSITCNVFALVPDMIPHKQRGIVWSLMAVSQILSGLAGLVLIRALSRISSPVLLAGVLLVGTGLCLPWLHEPGYRSRETTGARLWVNPRSSPDFARVWGGRVLVILAYALVGNFLYLYLKQGLRLADAQGRFTAFQALATVVLVGVSIAGGWLSDRTGARKRFVVVSSVLVSGALLLIAWTPSWGLMLVAASVLGAGFGCFLSADGALCTLVLPSRRERGKDLGWLLGAAYIAQILSAALVPAVFALFHSYGALFIAGAVCAVLGALLVSRVSVR